LSERKSPLVFLRDPRLAPYAMSQVPAWLWSADATRMLWGNPTAAAVFNAASPAELTGHLIDPKGTAALQIAKLAADLPHGSATRLQRLRGFGGRFGGPLMCACSRIVLADRTPAILIVATETAGPALPPKEQAKRLLAGCAESIAIFAADGAVMHATPRAQELLGHAPSLEALGLRSLADTAVTVGEADGDAEGVAVSLHRIGSGTSTALIAAIGRARLVGDRPQSAIASRAQPAAPIPVKPQTRMPPPAPLINDIEPSKKPLRFVWEIDADERFTVAAGEFLTLLGPAAEAELSKPWADVAARLDLDPEGEIARAIASRDTFSGIGVSFPIQGSDMRLIAELSGLPVFDRERNWRGYRGFGICRDFVRNVEPKRSAASTSLPQPGTDPSLPKATNAALENIVRFPSHTDPQPSFIPNERRPFNEMGRRITDGLAPSDLTPGPLPQDLSSQDLKSEDAAAFAAKTSLTPKAERSILDRLPIGVMVYRLDRLHYANRVFLEWTGYHDLGALELAGGFDALFANPADGGWNANERSKRLSITTATGEQIAVKALLFTTAWEGSSAMVLMLTSAGDATDRRDDIAATLHNVRSEAAQRADFLSKLSHEIRTPLNAMIGFSELMIEERFGPIGNDRYRRYLEDMRASGEHLAGLLGDLLDLSKIEAGRLELDFVTVNLNEAIQECVLAAQPQAGRERVVIRTSLSPDLPPVTADARAVRQIAHHLLGNSIKLAGPGGQVIVSTGLNDQRDVVLRVRDSGVGMTKQDLTATMEPFRQLSTSGRFGSGGTLLGLPLTKALAEANRAHFKIQSDVKSGTLVEVVFTCARLAAE
jgi:signal transduction histidine kinase